MHALWLLVSTVAKEGVLRANARLMSVNVRVQCPTVTVLQSPYVVGAMVSHATLGRLLSTMLLNDSCECGAG